MIFIVVFVGLGLVTAWLGFWGTWACCGSTLRVVIGAMMGVGVPIAAMVAFLFGGQSKSSAKP